MRQKGIWRLTHCLKGEKYSLRSSGGGDLLFESGVDTNLRAVMGFTADGATDVWFVPKADGIHDSTYTNQNDWAVMRYSLCREVVSPGGLVTNPVRCA
jgi:hypothetical protein